MSSGIENGVRAYSSDCPHGSPVLPFLLGTAVGGLAGAVVGTLLSGQAAHLLTLVLDVVERRDAGDRNRPKFEWMVQ
jgi:hypothetical protein